MQTGITCKKFPCYRRDSVFAWRSVENIYIYIIVNIFEINSGYEIQVSIYLPVVFLDRKNKTKLVPAFFLKFL